MDALTEENLNGQLHFCEVPSAPFLYSLKTSVTLRVVLKWNIGPKWANGLIQSGHIIYIYGDFNTLDKTPVTYKLRAVAVRALLKIGSCFGPHYVICIEQSLNPF